MNMCAGITISSVTSRLLSLVWEASTDMMGSCPWQHAGLNGLRDLLFLNILGIFACVMFWTCATFLPSILGGYSIPACHKVHNGS